MNAATPFDEVDLETWRARVAKTGRDRAALTHASLEGIEIEALYDRTPGPLSVPPRAGGTWTCIQTLPAAPERAAAVVAKLADAQVDGVWIEGPSVATILAALPRGLAAHVDAGERGGDAPPRATAWLHDPCAPGMPRTSATAAVEAALARQTPRSVRTWLCDGAVWHDAGATAVDEIAIVLAALLGALRRMGDRGISAGEASSTLLMRVGLGGDVLVDVAKIRALRGLWHACAHHLGVATAAIPVFARTGRRLRSRYDADTNLVRATLELFAAATAGADALVVEPHQPEDAGDGAHRWARNLAHLMRHESHLDAVDDPFAGAWAVESLTRSLAQAAWARVQALEATGGLWAAVDRGDVQRDVAAAAHRRRIAAATGTHPIIGVSRFPPKGRASPDVVVPTAAAGFGPLDLCAPFEAEGGAR